MWDIDGFYQFQVSVRNSKDGYVEIIHCASQRLGPNSLISSSKFSPSVIINLSSFDKR